MPKHYTPKEQSVNDRNPNNDGYKASLVNHGNQLNREHPEHNGGTSKSGSNPKK